jgi:hypothetical protein
MRQDDALKRVEAAMCEHMRKIQLSIEERAKKLVQDGYRTEELVILVKLGHVTVEVNMNPDEPTFIVHDFTTNNVVARTPVSKRVLWMRLQWRRWFPYKPDVQSVERRLRNV